MAVAVVAAAGLAIPMAYANHYQASLEGSQFQIDTNANFVVDADTITGGLDTGPVANLDWNSVTESRQVDQATGGNDDSYSGGTKEDTVCPGTGTGSIPNNKSDLKTFGVYAEAGTSAGDPGYLHLFWTRVSDPSGTTLMDFEFNQSSQTCSTGVNKTRTADDLLIEYSLVQGGARAVITLRKWTGSAWGTAATFTANEATGTTNTSLIKAADTGGVSAVDLNARTFGEASIDLDAVFDSSKCTSFGSAMLKSRSSDSFTSQLKDFIAPLPITLSNCAQVIIRKQTSREGATELFNFTKSFATDPASADTFQLADNGVYTKTNVLLGSNYTVAETLTTLPAGWEFDSIDCSASSGVAPSINAATATATFSLDATSDKVDCTFYNKEQVGAIKVTKVVAGTTTALAGASFAIDADGDPATTGDQTNIPAVVGSPGVFCLGNLAFGSYTVVETQVPTGYTGAAPQTVNVTGAGTCASGAATATFENKKNPTLGTVPRLLPNDQATLSDGFGTLTGTLAFRLFANATCTGTALYSQDVPVNGNGPYTTTNTSTFITADGTYSWLVTYTSTSGSNNGAVSSCTAEQQKVDFTPLAAP